MTIGGTVTSYYQDVPPGATIVLLTIAAFIAADRAGDTAGPAAREARSAAGDPPAV